MEDTKQQKDLKEQLHLKEQLEQLETIAKQHLTPEAIARYGNIKTVHTEKAVQSLIIIVELVKKGRIHTKLTDTQYKDILRNLTPEKKEFTITRK